MRERIVEPRGSLTAAHGEPARFETDERPGRAAHPRRRLVVSWASVMASVAVQVAEPADRAPPLDLLPLRTLLQRIEAKFHPEQIWLFGSRARGDARPWSDWDLFVVVPDDTDEDLFDPRVAWRLKRGSGVQADVIPCRASDFLSACDTVNTLSYVVASEGVRIDGR